LASFVVDASVANLQTRARDRLACYCLYEAGLPRHRTGRLGLAHQRRQSKTTDLALNYRILGGHTLIVDQADAGRLYVRSTSDLLPIDAQHLAVAQRLVRLTRRAMCVDEPMS